MTGGEMSGMTRRTKPECQCENIPDQSPLTPALSRKGRGSQGCRAASHAASSLFGHYAQDDNEGVFRMAGGFLCICLFVCGTVESES